MAENQRYCTRNPGWTNKSAAYAMLANSHMAHWWPFIAGLCLHDSLTSVPAARGVRSKLLLRVHATACNECCSSIPERCRARLSHSSGCLRRADFQLLLTPLPLFRRLALWPCCIVRHLPRWRAFAGICVGALLSAACLSGRAESSPDLTAKYAGSALGQPRQRLVQRWAGVFSRVGPIGTGSASGSPYRLVPQPCLNLRCVYCSPSKKTHSANPRWAVYARLSKTYWLKLNNK